jgi:hypothetical protein
MKIDEKVLDHWDDEEEEEESKAAGETAEPACHHSVFQMYISSLVDESSVFLFSLYVRFAEYRCRCRTSKMPTEKTLLLLLLLGQA